MVVALYGNWGTGKTSSLNLCFEALGRLPSEQQPLVVWFNPWCYSNTGELLTQFFKERVFDEV
jgi:predicted KAP-like P-loop ATPase